MLTDSPTKWASMVKNSKSAIEDFNNFADDNAIVWADNEMGKLQAEIETMRDVVELARTLKNHLLEPICGGAMTGMSDKRRRMYRDLMIELKKFDALKGGQGNCDKYRNWNDY